MAVSILESLVLRGVSVRCDGKTIGLRLGTSYKAALRAPTLPFSMRHPSPGTRDTNPPADGPGHEATGSVFGAVSGAGRSHCRAGVPSRRSPARSAGRTIPSGWAAVEGGPKPAAASLSLIGARVVASVREVPSGRLATAHASGLQGQGLQPVAGYAAERWAVGRVWHQSASRTPSASTWGKGVC